MQEMYFLGRDGFSPSRTYPRMSLISIDDANRILLIDVNYVIASTVIGTISIANQRLCFLLPLSECPPLSSMNLLDGQGN